MKRNTIELVRQNGKILKFISLDEINWKSINYVDYIAVDYNNKVTHEFKIVHGENAYQNMQILVDSYDY